MGDVGTTYREGAEAFYDEDKDVAIDRFDEVLKHPGNPTLALAADLRARAEDLPDDNGSSLWLWLAILAAVVIVVASGAYLVMRRRGGSAALGEPALAGVPAGGGAGSVAPERPMPPSTPPASADTAVDETKPALLIVGARGETAKRHQLEGEMTIGREATDILLTDEQASRRHALIRVSNGQVELSDLDSANGTEVNGVRITSTVALGHGDTIRVGNTDLRVELPRSMRGPGPSEKTVIST